jgi:hypothetical protein
LVLKLTTKPARIKQFRPAVLGRPANKRVRSGGQRCGFRMIGIDSPKHRFGLRSYPPIFDGLSAVRSIESRITLTPGKCLKHPTGKRFHIRGLPKGPPRCYPRAGGRPPDRR